MQIFLRGVEYAKRGRVQKARETKKLLQALVKGSQLYEVEFRQGPKYVKGYCVCPYAFNEDYCKHVVALAIYRDCVRGIPLPTEREIRQACMQQQDSLDKNIQQMYRDPLHADLKFLATASDYGSRPKSHSRIELFSCIEDTQKPISSKEARIGFQKIARLVKRFHYNPYLCAGEVSAILSLAYDTIVKRLAISSKEQYLKVMAECILFYYNTYLQMIDGSDGVWQIPLARLQTMLSDMNSHRITREEQDNLCVFLNARISGWGDIFEDLHTQFT